MIGRGDVVRGKEFVPGGKLHVDTLNPVAITHAELEGELIDICLQPGVSVTFPVGVIVTKENIFRTVILEGATLVRRGKRSD